MRKLSQTRALLSGAALAGMLIFTAACNSASSAAATSTTAAAAVGGSTPKPNAAQEQAILTGLRAIDPAIVGTEAGAIDNARNTCSSILAGVPDATLLRNTKLRFDHTDLTDDQAEQIIELVKTTFCH